MLLWLANHTRADFMRPRDTALPYDLYRDMARQRAEQIRAENICRDTRQIQTVEVVEYFDRETKHYFYTADPVEIATIERNSVRGGWARTGFGFKAFASEATAPATALPVCRFSGKPGVGPNSHFFALAPEECAMARMDAGWVYEGVPFYLVKPTWSICPSYAGHGRTSRIWRAYNNGFAHNDSNFRLTTGLDGYFAMQVTGWALQGVAMCAAE
jgi:serine protease